MTFPTGVVEIRKRSDRELKKMAEGDRFSPRAKRFIKEISQGTVNSTDAIRQNTANMTDEKFAILKRLMEKRSRGAAHVTVTPVSTAQHCIPPRSIPRFRQMFM